jgi:hypothetical protein
VGRILYLAELFKKTGWEPVLCTTPNNFDRENNIYYLETARDLTSYWVTTWGGYFDTPDNTNVQILLNQFLLQVTSEALLKATENSFYVSGTKIYINVPLKPWQYFKYLAELSDSDITSFSSSVKNPLNPSDIKYSGRKFFPKLSAPKLRNKLSDSISGLSLTPIFSFNILNNDGAYDDLDEFNFFNTPAIVKKSTVKDSPDLSDFKIVRRGLIDDVVLDYNKYGIRMADYNKFFTDEVCRKFTVEEFPNIADDVKNKRIPIGYDTLKRIPLIEVDRDSGDPATWVEYVAIEPSQLFSVSKVYSDDGAELTFSVTNGIIRVTSVDDDGEVIDGKNSDIEGKQGYALGGIITELINDVSVFKYLEGNWDVTETNAYIALSDDVGFYFAGGELKSAIDELLKNDTAFLFAKNDGRLTIRRWGETYDTHTIESWQINNPQKIKKDSNVKSKYYLSTAEVNYNKFYDLGSFGDSYIDESKEREIVNEYRKSKIGKFDTALINASDVQNLATRIIDRFGNLNVPVSLDTVYDTAEINLLDRVNLEIQTNDRLFSLFTGWYVREVDPGQDSLLLEPIPGTETARAILDNYEFAILDNEGNAVLGS